MLKTNREIKHEIRAILHEVSLGLELYKHLQKIGSAGAENVLDKVQARIEQAGHCPLFDDTPQTPLQNSENTILLVDDSPQECEYLARLLRVNGVAVETAADGIEAMAYLRHSIPHAVLVDMQMPKCDGPELIQQIREDLRLDGLAIYGISGTSPEENELDDASLAGWIQKPATLSKFMPFVHEMRQLGSADAA